MIGLDTNVVVRYLVQDDPRQSALATEVVEALTETSPGFLSLVTIIETYWVLNRAYRVRPSRCLELLEGLTDARELRVDREPVMRSALALARNGVDLADALIAELGRGAGCQETVTFDNRAARGGLMRLLAPQRPAVPGSHPDDPEAVR